MEAWALSAVAQARLDGLCRYSGSLPTGNPIRNVSGAHFGPKQKQGLHRGRKPRACPSSVKSRADKPTYVVFCLRCQRIGGTHIPPAASKLKS